MRSRWSGARRMALVFISLLAGTVMTVRTLSRRFIFPAWRVTTPAAPIGFLVRIARARDGQPVRILELPGDAGARVVVHLHANRETAEHNAPLAHALHGAGFGVLLVEYRGYGRSSGSEPSEDGLYADAEAALDLLARRGVRREQIVLWGASLGTGVASEMARRGRAGALVLLAPFTAIPDVIAAAAPYLPAGWLVQDTFDTLSRATLIRVPTLVVHGDADAIVPFAMGMALSRTIRNANLLRVPGGGHGDLMERAGLEIIAAVLRLGAPHAARSSRSSLVPASPRSHG